MTEVSERLRRQMAFLRELDRLKTVLRRTAVGDRSRRENSAEHSWHMTAMAVVLGKEKPAGVDVSRVIGMIIVHDVVEIDAGDTFAFDMAGHVDKAERERAAAERIFALLPDDQAVDLRGLWEEFEEGTTPDARMANALDRFAALLQNTQNGDGGTWHEHAITREAVMRRMEPIREGLPVLWPYVLEAVEDAAGRGLLGGESPR